MNDSMESLEARLNRLGKQLAEQPSIVDRVMRDVDRAAPVRSRRFNPRRIVAMLFKPQALAAAAAVVALVVFGFRPWYADRENSAGAWWLSPPTAWAGELHADIQKAEQQGYSCREQFINVTTSGEQATSSTINTLFVSGNRYRRDIYDEGHLRESQWYHHGPDGLTLTSVRYEDKIYSVTTDPQAVADDESPTARFEMLARRLEASGWRVGTTQLDGHDAVEFEISAQKLDARDDAATVHVWLDQITKMPLKITYEFATPGGLGQIARTILVQDRFDWQPTLPSNTFQPEIPAGFANSGNN
jgi:hypothetical protein